MKAPSFKGLFIVLAVLGFNTAHAQNSFAPDAEPDKWQQLSPDSRDQMRRQYLESLPPTKKEKLRSQVKRFNSMPPTKKQKLCRRFEEDRGYLPPACRKLF